MFSHKVRYFWILFNFIHLDLDDEFMSQNEFIQEFIQVYSSSVILLPLAIFISFWHIFGASFSGKSSFPHTFKNKWQLIFRLYTILSKKLDILSDTKCHTGKESIMPH